MVHKNCLSTYPQKKEKIGYSGPDNFIILLMTLIKRHYKNAFYPNITSQTLVLHFNV